jgi:aminoglycoside phosphotransferase
MLGAQFKAIKHTYSNQDEVYKIETPGGKSYYLKVSATLKTEYENLRKLDGTLNVPKVIGFHHADTHDYLLISELPGNNLAELATSWPKLKVVDTFAEAVRHLHTINASNIFPEAGATDVLLHGDMAMPNIIIAEETPVGYIDLGQLSFGPPELDLADAIWSLQRNIGPDYGELFLEKYGPVARTSKIEAALAYKYTPLA